MLRLRGRRSGSARIAALPAAAPKRGILLPVDPPPPAGSSPFPGGQPPVRRCASRSASPSGRTLRRCSSGAMPSCESCVEWQRRRRPPVRAGLRGSDPGPATGGPRADGPPAVPDPSGRRRAAPDPAPGVAVREVLDAPGLPVWSRVLASCFPAPESPAPPALLGGPTRFWLAPSTASRPPPRCRTPPTARFAWRRWPPARPPGPGPRCGGDLGGDAGPARAGGWATCRWFAGRCGSVLTIASDIHPDGATSGGHVRAVPIVSGPTGGQPREELP
jgi:hypothetical protein